MLTFQFYVFYEFGDLFIIWYYSVSTKEAIMKRKTFWRVFDAMVILLASLVLFFWAFEGLVSYFGSWKTIVISSTEIVLGVVVFCRGCKTAMVAVLIMLDSRVPRRITKRRKKRL